MKYALSIADRPDEDWFKKNATPELLKRIYSYLPETSRETALENLLDLDNPELD